MLTAARFRHAGALSDPTTPWTHDQLCVLRPALLTTPTAIKTARAGLEDMLVSSNAHVLWIEVRTNPKHPADLLMFDLAHLQHVFPPDDIVTRAVRAALNIGRPASAVLFDTAVNATTETLSAFRESSGE